MDVQVLRWFQQVADGTTVTDVAQRSFISQSAVSRALARLDVEIGTPLLERSGRILRVTRSGAVFKQHIDRVLADLDDGLAHVARGIDPESGILRLAFLQTLAGWLVPDLLRSFRAEHPRIKVLLSQIVDDAHPAMHEGTADLELSTRTVAEAGTESFVVVTEPIVLAVPDGHALQGEERAGLGGLAGAAFIGLHPQATLRALTDELCRNAGFEPDLVFEADDVATIRGLVAGGLGVALVPAPRVGGPGAETGPIHYVPLTDAGAHREVRLCWTAGAKLSRPVELFRDHVARRSRRGELPPVTAAG